MAGANPGLGHVRFLAAGLTRGLMRTHQTFSLTRFLQAASDPNAHYQLEPVAAVAVAMRNTVSDQGLRDVLGAVHGLPLAEKGSLMRQVEALPMAFGERYRLQRVILRQEGAFAGVRDSLMAQAPTTTAASSSSTTTTGSSLDETPSATASPQADEGAAHISRLTDLYRYFGEGEGLEFAFEGEPDLARIRGADAQVRERIAFSRPRSGSCRRWPRQPTRANRRRRCSSGRAYRQWRRSHSARAWTC